MDSSVAPDVAFPNNDCETDRGSRDHDLSVDGKEHSSTQQYFRASRSSEPQTLPVYVRRGISREQLVLAYFPAGPTGSHLSSRISALSRNNVDGRVRCELTDSTVHDRESTEDGIPIDYQLVCQSSSVPVSAYRTNYHAVKRNGKLYLTPIDVVHVRMVLEPSGVRSETQRVGIVSHGFQQASRPDPTVSTGKWISFKPNLSADSSCLQIDGKNIHAYPTLRCQDSADFPTVVDCALELGGPKPPRPLRVAAEGLVSIDAVFKATSRIQRTVSVQKKLNKPLDEVVSILNGTACLVQGNWVGPGSFFFKGVSDKTKVPFSMCFDYLLYHFHKDRMVDISVPNKVLNLKKDSLLNVVRLIAKHFNGERWKFLEEPDKEFIRNYPDVVKQQDLAWEGKRRMIEEYAAELAKQQPGDNVDSGNQNGTSTAHKSSGISHGAPEMSISPVTNIAASTKGRQTVAAPKPAPVASGAGLITSKNARGGKRSIAQVEPAAKTPAATWIKRKYTRSSRK